MTSKVEKGFRIALAALLVLGLSAVPAFASDTSSNATAAVQDSAPMNLTPLVALGAGLVTLGGAFGIGRLADSAMEGTARQPEAGKDIRTSMIIAAALIEGFTFFALIVCIMSRAG